MMQILTLVLDDGRRFNFTIPAVFTDKDLLTEIFVTEPKPMPEGYSWKNLTNIKEEGK